MCQERACLGSSLGSLGAMGMKKLWSSRAWLGAQESECKPGPGQSPEERGPRVKLRRQVCVSRLEGLRLRVRARAPWSCMGLWKASTWPREWGHACCPSHSPARVSHVPWLLLGIFQSPGLRPVPLPPARDSDEPWPEQLWGADSSVPRPERQQWVWTAWDGSARLVLVRGAHRAVDMCVVSPSGTVLPQGLQGLRAAVWGF